jgi:hypothetical protein
MKTALPSLISSWKFFGLFSENPKSKQTKQTIKQALWSLVCCWVFLFVVLFLPCLSFCCGIAAHKQASKQAHTLIILIIIIWA